jgi:WD40 repeat protein
MQHAIFPAHRGFAALVVAASLGGMLAAQAPTGPAAFTPDGKMLAQGQGKTIAVIDVLSQKELIRMIGHKDMVLSLGYSPDGKLLASGGADKAVNLWDAPTGRVLQQMRLGAAVIAVSFSNDGKNLITHEADKTRRQFDIATGKLLKKEVEKDEKAQDKKNDTK